MKEEWPTLDGVSDVVGGVVDGIHFESGLGVCLAGCVKFV